ncbi:ArsC/Spx/MgsR family protein [Allobaculum sp. Allo2]|uniref:ArsC/Spx/MgsR family protein n=1 Tax=Allobaculum sp. Allo2 TaxID=2853432 RepID=UPI00272E2D52|nr:ArsC/Spx/MgsR family protein [Allobaculum sp. Allo2]
MLIQRNPSILKRPIMLSERTMVVGYDDDEITALIPQGNRESQRDEMPGTLSLPAAQCTSGVRRI